MPSALVGRRHELALLARALERAAGGQRGAVLILGEAGVGKTRLAREAVASARDQGFFVLERRAHAPESAVPYGILLDALGPEVRALEPRVQQRLFEGAPQLLRLFDPTSARDDGVHKGEGDGEGLEKTRLYAPMTRLLARLAAPRPLVLLLDDLQWADAASLELLHFAVRNLEAARLLVLGTFRDDANQAGLLALARSFRRLGLGEEITSGVSITPRRWRCSISCSRACRRRPKSRRCSKRVRAACHCF